VVLSSVQPETITMRFMSPFDKKAEEEQPTKVER
jgi:regulator of extracellular matrix RemA (YlzA/DUF370 family)